MLASDVANRPRWRGQPGFFEIWFLVVFDPRAGRAWWLRYTTFAPFAGAPRATLWAFDRTELGPTMGNRMSTVGPAGVVFRATSARAQVVVTATCDPRTLVGWVYRDPAGWDVHVAQSDVASCRVEIRRRRGRLAPWQIVRELRCRARAALEFHHPEPLPGVRYVGWEEST